MNNSLKTILDQCEKQAEKISGMEVNASFIKELDIFDSYFGQLKQLTQNVSLDPEDREKLNKLKHLTDACASKLQSEMKRIADEIKRAGTEKHLIGYGSSQATEALKFDKRF